MVVTCSLDSARRKLVIKDIHTEKAGKTVSEMRRCILNNLTDNILFTTLYIPPAVQ
jgi:hypothetical protein